MREEILNKINSSARLARINLSDMKICDGEIKEIMDFIHARNPKISKFDLDKNLLTDEGAKILSQCLQHFDNVEELSLQDNKIDKDGALAIFQLKNNFSVLDIAFCGNQLSDVSEMDEIERMASSLNTFNLNAN